MDFPERFQTNITQVFGERGQAWLSVLPELIEAFSRRWSIQLVGQFPLSFNFVAPGIRMDGSPVVIKIGVPDPELLSEMAALRLFDGRGMVRLLESDPEKGAMLLERVTPGKMLSDLQDDDEATRIITRVMRRIWRPLTPKQAQSFHSLERWTRAFKKYQEEFPNSSGPFPLAIFNRAEGILRENLAAQGEIVLLHGDLHHDNILTSEREPWLVIDPKGVAGEREFEVGPMFYNPWQRVLTWPDLDRVCARRVAILSEELSFDRQKVVRWAFVETVLSMLWSLEGTDPTWNAIMPITQALEKLL